LKVTALAGGVGGAKLADGLARVLNPDQLTVIVNTGDDFKHFGLWICPDLDTVCYTLAGLANPEKGWGRAEETFNVLDEIASLQGPAWFQLGDRDLATHLERTRLLDEGLSLSQVTRQFCQIWGIRETILPMSDAPAPTRVLTGEGEMAFQQYFVLRRCEPTVTGFRFDWVEIASPAPGVLEALDNADLIVICPSNPWVSIDPILAVPGIRRKLADAFVLAVSPIIGGEAVKGPAAKMYRELGIIPSPVTVAAHYQPFLRGLIMDQADEKLSDTILSGGLNLFVTDTIMKDRSDRERLAEEVLKFAESVVSP
jgi:LPPG:FO 2-phospho-L-lactate transferase